MNVDDFRPRIDAAFGNRAPVGRCDRRSAFAAAAVPSRKILRHTPISAFRPIACGKSIAAFFGPFFREKYGAGGDKALENGRIRYYGPVQPANGARSWPGVGGTAHEFDTATGCTARLGGMRPWIEWAMFPADSSRAARQDGETLPNLIATAGASGELVNGGRSPSCLSGVRGCVERLHVPRASGPLGVRGGAGVKKTGVVAILATRRKRTHLGRCDVTLRDQHDEGSERVPSLQRRHIREAT